MVKTLITLGAKPDLWTNRTSRNTAIAIASACGHLHVVEVILANGGRIGARGAVYGARGETDAFSAAVHGLHPTEAIWLVKHGFDVCKEIAPRKLAMLRRLAASKRMPNELEQMLECDARIHGSSARARMH